MSTSALTWLDALRERLMAFVPGRATPEASGCLRT